MEEHNDNKCWSILLCSTFISCLLWRVCSSTVSQIPHGRGHDRCCELNTKWWHGGMWVEFHMCPDWAPVGFRSVSAAFRLVFLQYEWVAPSLDSGSNVSDWGQSGTLYEHMYIRASTCLGLGSWTCMWNWSTRPWAKPVPLPTCAHAHVSSLTYFLSWGCLSPDSGLWLKRFIADSDLGQMVPDADPRLNQNMSTGVWR